MAEMGLTLAAVPLAIAVLPLGGYLLAARLAAPAPPTDRRARGRSI